jgi:diguanylate cyclase (GGDEF)-like protein/PAS domain S-box-containing protein
LKNFRNGNQGFSSSVTSVMFAIAAVSAISLALTYFALSIQAGVRGYIAGEANWSKSQYSAVSSLVRFGETGDSHYYEQFTAAMAIPLGDKQARLELMKNRYDYEIARSGFLQGGVHSDDIAVMIALFRCCHSVPPMKEVVALWAQGDEGLEKLSNKAQELQSVITADGPGSARAKQLVSEIEQLDKRIRVLASAFTKELASAARFINHAVFLLVAAIALIVFFLAAWFARSVLKRFQKTEARFRALLNSANDAVVLADESTGTVLDFNPKTEQLIGLPPGKILGAEYSALFEEANSSRPNDAAHFTRSARLVTRPNVAVEVNSSTVDWIAGPARLHIIRDVSDRIAAQRQLQIAHSSLANLAEGVMILDSRLHVVSINRAYSRITGYSQSDVLGKLPPLPRARKSDARAYLAIRRTLRKTGSWRGEILNQRKNGDYYSELHRVSCVRDESGKITHFVCVFDDNTAIRENERKLQFLAQRDSLTKLLNRSKFEETAKEAVQIAAQKGTKTALLFIDLDNFKTINDTFGHTTGDKYLTTIGSRIANSLRSTDLIGRVGGDEFAVLLSDVNSRADVVTVASKLRTTIAQQVEFDGYEVSSSASVGLCLYPDDATSVEELFVHADAAMYEAKRRGRNNLQWFTRELVSAVEKKLMLVSGLRVAAQRGQLELHYQPIMDIRTGAVRSLEALLRWTHPELGRVSPGVFIPLAEEFGVIDSLTDFVLREACRQGREWMDAGFKPVPIAVNLSPRNFWDADLSHKVRAILDESGWPAKYMRLEITESTIMGGENPGFVMQQLRELGVSLSIDDFGIGHSSLSSLQNFPVQCMKIDLSFVRGIPENQTNLTIVKTIISLAKNLGLDLIAEGIETKQQADALLQEGCAQGQGYYYCKPQVAKDIETFLHGGARNNVIPVAFS